MLPNNTDFTSSARPASSDELRLRRRFRPLPHAPGLAREPRPREPAAHGLDRARRRPPLRRAGPGRDREPGGQLTYFSVLGELVRYPQGLALPLALLATAALAATTLYARRRAGVRARGVAWAAGGFLLLLIATTALGIGVWQALLLLRPGYGSFPLGDTYRPGWYAAGALALAASLTFAWYLLLRRRHTPEEVSLAIWAWLAALALVTAAFVPGAAYLFTWPALAGSVALAAAVRWGGADPAWRWLACCRGSRAGDRPAPAVGGLLYGLSFAAFPMIVAVLVLVSALPVLDLLAPAASSSCRWRRRWSGSRLFGAGLRVDTFDEQHPRQTSLVYALDADREEAMWISGDPDPAPWTDRYVDAEHTGLTTDSRQPDLLPPVALPRRTGVHSPDRTRGRRGVRSEREGDTRELRLRITPARPHA